MPSLPRTTSLPLRSWSSSISQVREAPSRSLETPAFPADRGSVVYQRDASVDSRQ
jgi:hypothetical protein